MFCCCWFQVRMWFLSSCSVPVTLFILECPWRLSSASAFRMYSGSKFNISLLSYRLFILYFLHFIIMQVRHISSSYSDVGHSWRYYFSLHDQLLCSTMPGDVPGYLGISHKTSQNWHTVKAFTDIARLFDMHFCIKPHVYMVHIQRSFQCKQLLLCLLLNV